MEFIYTLKAHALWCPHSPPRSRRRCASTGPPGQPAGAPRTCRSENGSLRKPPSPPAGWAPPPWLPLPPPGPPGGPSPLRKLWLGGASRCPTGRCPAPCLPPLPGWWPSPPLPPPASSGAALSAPRPDDLPAQRRGARTRACVRACVREGAGGRARRARVSGTGLAKPWRHRPDGPPRRSATRAGCPCSPSARLPVLDARSRCSSSTYRYRHGSLCPRTAGGPARQGEPKPG
jgi:hypothetical protein